MKSKPAREKIWFKESGHESKAQDKESLKEIEVEVNEIKIQLSEVKTKWDPCVLYF